MEYKDFSETSSLKEQLIAAANTCKISKRFTRSGMTKGIKTFVSVRNIRTFVCSVIKLIGSALFPTKQKIKKGIKHEQNFL